MRFQFQNSISIFKFPLRHASLNIVWVYIMLIVWNCCHVLRLTLYVYISCNIRPFVYIILYHVCLHNIFTYIFSSELLPKHYNLLSELLLHNTIFYICQNYICICLRHQTKSRFVTHWIYTKSRFITFIFYTFSNITL